MSWMQRYYDGQCGLIIRGRKGISGQILLAQGDRMVYSEL